MPIKQRDCLKDDTEHAKLVRVGDSFWEKFSKLAGEHVSMMPPELHLLTLTYLQDKCSIYGSEYYKHVVYGTGERIEQPEEALERIMKESGV